MHAGELRQDRDSEPRSAHTARYGNSPENPVKWNDFSFEMKSNEAVNCEEVLFSSGLIAKVQEVLVLQGSFLTSECVLLLIL